MENIALFATDLDGTLLYDNINMAQRDKQALERLKQLGCKICFATGREFEVITPAMDRLQLWDLVDYFIMCGGSQIYDVKERKLHVIAEITPENMHYLYNTYKHLPTAVVIPRDSIFHTNHISDGLIEEGKMLGCEIKVYDDMTEVLDKPNPKFLFFGTAEQIDESIAVMSKDTNEEVTICKSQWKYIDCYAKGVDKGTAVKHLCKQLDIDLSQTASIGDNDNDIAMFEVTAFSACTGEATDNAKQKAKYICCNANEGAVYDFCKHLKLI